MSLYLVSGILAPKRKGREKTTTYACGERIRLGSLKITVTLYEYLTYFIVLDSAAILVMFIALSLTGFDTYITVLVYLAIILVSALVLRGEG